SALRFPKRSIDHLNVRACTRSSSRHSGRSKPYQSCLPQKEEAPHQAGELLLVFIIFILLIIRVLPSGLVQEHSALPSPTDVLQVPFLDSFVSLEPPEPPREDLEWQQ
ncbi:hypothetical protein M9458_023399, partial [Cirrhinus mrigala]